MMFSKRDRLKTCCVIDCRRSCRSICTFGETNCCGIFCCSTRITDSDVYFGGMIQADANTISQPRKSGPRIHQRRRTTMAQYSSSPRIDFWSSNSSVMIYRPRG